MTIWVRRSSIEVDLDLLIAVADREAWRNGVAGRTSALLADEAWVRDLVRALRTEALAFEPYPSTLTH